MCIHYTKYSIYINVIHEFFISIYDQYDFKLRHKKNCIRFLFQDNFISLHINNYCSGNVALMRID